MSDYLHACVVLCCLVIHLCVGVYKCVHVKSHLCIVYFLVHLSGCDCLREATKVVKDVELFINCQLYRVFGFIHILRRNHKVVVELLGILI